MLGGTPKTFGDRPNISGFLTSTPDDESHFASPEVRVTVVTCRCGRRNLPCCKYDARMAVGVCGRERVCCGGNGGEISAFHFTPTFRSRTAPSKMRRRHWWI